MFTNLDKYSVWDLMTDSVKFNDRETTQMLYEGEERGQTQRYLITAGDMVVSLFQKIEDLYSYGDPYSTDADFLTYLQRQYFARYLTYSPATEGLVRYFLSEIIQAWRLKGTYAFFHWIIWKVFGWQLLYSLSITRVFRLNLVSSFLYTPTVAVDDHKVLFDNATMGGGGFSATLYIDVFSDADYLDKYPVLESLVSEWGVSFKFEYINTP